MAHSAIVIPVPEAESIVGSLRRDHTRDGAAGMAAHVTLIYPFADDALLTASLADRARGVLQRFPAFAFRLTAPRRFTNLTATHVWLEPEPASRFMDMVGALGQEFPEYPPYCGTFDMFVPHLTVASSSDAETLCQVERELKGILPIAACARSARLMVQVDGHWRLRDEVRFAARG